MTEAEWPTSNDALAMLQALKGKTIATERKLRLFTCASLRRFLREQPRLLDLLEIAERYIEGKVTDAERRVAVTSIPMEELQTLYMNLVRHTLNSPIEGYQSEREWWHYATAAALHSKAEADGPQRDAALLRDLFHSPLIRRLPRVTPFWRERNDGLVPRLAQAIYEERAFDRLPILADALEEVGCTHADILAHCRGPGPHGRGCWVVDLMTGRK